MTQTSNIEELLQPISESAPAGGDLRYTTCYEEIMEARRCEDAIAMGEWRHDVKTANWAKVIALTTAALRDKSKDLQIAAWLTEALTVLEGFHGLDLGLQLVAGLVERFWDGIYPQPEDGDLEYRAAPFRFLDEKVALRVKEIPLTDPQATPGYSWLQWLQSREVGSETDTLDRFGGVDEEKKSRREQLVAEQAVTWEAFGEAAEWSKGAFAEEVHGQLFRCKAGLERLSELLDEKFPDGAPSLSDLALSVGECESLVNRLYGDAPGEEDEPLCAGSGEATAFPAERSDVGGAADAVPALQTLARAASSVTAGTEEHTLWGEASAMLEAGRFHEGLAMLLYTSNSADSVRDRNRVRLLMAKLCLKAGRSDLGRPIIEELHGIIEELHLERWESPLWIADVLDAYYRSLQADGPRECDVELSRALFRRICSLDVTKAMPYCE